MRGVHEATPSLRSRCSVSPRQTEDACTVCAGHFGRQSAASHTIATIIACRNSRHISCTNALELPALIVHAGEVQPVE